MEIQNNSPPLSLNELIIQLFNNQKLADIQFHCGDKVIFAHSFLLMSRSVVYEAEFCTNQGTQKLIPVQKYDYDTKLEFLRFIYTDECEITKSNFMDLLELSVKYKIPKLEYMVVGYMVNLENSENEQLTIEEKLKIFNFCETLNYEFLRNWVCVIIGTQMLQIINSELLLSFPRTLLESILELDEIGTESAKVYEVQLFNALINWMNHYCVNNCIPLTQRRSEFQDLIRLVRFPVLSVAELSDCIKKSDNLFTGTEVLELLTANRDEISGTIRKVTKEILYDSPYYPKSIHKFQVMENLIITSIKFSCNIDRFDLVDGNLSLRIKCRSSSGLNGENIYVSSDFGAPFPANCGTVYRIELPESWSTSSIKSRLKQDIVEEPFKEYYYELEKDSRVIKIMFKFPEGVKLMQRMRRP